MASQAAQRTVRHCAALATRPATSIGVHHARIMVVRSNNAAVIVKPRGPASLLVNLRSVQATRALSTDASAKLGPMNGDIRSRMVSVVGDDGKMRRDVPFAQALQEARSAGVDLVQVANNNGQAVCRMFNAQKRLFTLKKAMKQSKPKQDKEVSFGVKTEAHDINTKAAQVRGFLSKGHKVKVTVKFGREFHLLERAQNQLKVIEEVVGPEVGGPEANPQNQYGGVYVYFVPRSQK